MEEKKKDSKENVTKTLEKIVSVGTAVVTVATVLVKALGSGKKD